MMKWIKAKEQLPPENTPVLITNHGYQKPENPRFYVVAERRGCRYFDPESDDDEDEIYYFEPDYWCEIEPPKND